MKSLLLASAVMATTLGFMPQAHAQKEAMGMFYELKMAPAVCKWTNAADSKKLDATITSQEQGLAITASDKADLMKQAEADLRSDPSNCAPDGMVRAMYDEAVK